MQHLHLQNSRPTHHAPAYPFTQGREHIFHTAEILQMQVAQRGPFFFPSQWRAYGLLFLPERRQHVYVVQLLLNTFCGFLNVFLRSSWHKRSWTYSPTNNSNTCLGNDTKQRATALFHVLLLANRSRAPFGSPASGCTFYSWLSSKACMYPHSEGKSNPIAFLPAS